MHVSAVEFRGFKSLYEVSTRLAPLTVITGPNGAGKSNLVDGLNFIGEVYAHGLEFAVSRAGGYDNIAHRRTRRAKRPISISVELEVMGKDSQNPDVGWAFFGLHDRPIPESFFMRFRHTFSLRTSSQSLLADYEVVEDRIEILDRQDRLVASLSRMEGASVDVFFSDRRFRHMRVVREMLRPFSEEGYEQYWQDSISTSRSGLMTDQVFRPNVLWGVKRGLSRTKVFQLSPFQCRTSGVPTPNASLERHGENLPGAADHLRRNDADAWERVQRAMRSVMPALDEIEIAYTEDRRLALQFREKGVGRPWSTGEVSDGTIQALALFVALFDRRSPLLVIEEPENSVHPWILRQFLDHCAEAESVGKQILLTTHSPVLLNYVAPELVHLMFISAGRSNIRPLLGFSAAVRELVMSGEVSLFDAYDSGVDAFAVPPGLSPNSDVEDEDL